MEKLGLNEIRERFLSFYQSKGHYRMPSFPLVPQNDASLLLINSGMAPLKPYFTGAQTPPSKRATTCQKCIRTPDIERVGKTARHGTFFEMLGNFSFGDYFKHEATAWAWEFITKEMKMPVDKLWITIYEDDDEAFDIWTKEVGIPPERIVRMGKEDNFWEIGTGPCGPCSEIYFDRGVENGCGKPDCAVGCECDRFVEFWNLVFTQFEKDDNGEYHRLAHPNIDTGMGLERLAAIMQGVPSLFDVDTIQNIMKHVAKLANVKYGENDATDVSLRVITDHIRSTTFLVSDGVVPSNEGRGYVLRRLLRRAARHGRLLGINEAFLSDVAMTVINESKGAYPELEEKKEYIKKVISIEEERFELTINQGLEILGGLIENLESDGKKILSGADAFKLYDTYGFPIDLTREILAEKGLDVDEDAFNTEMDCQRERARAGRNVGEDAAWSENIYAQIDKSITTEFIGYDNAQTNAFITAIVANGEIVESVGSGEEASIICDKTVFYAESGGQEGDIGTIRGDNFTFEVKETKKVGGGKIAHIGTVTGGAVSVGDTAILAYDKETRMAAARNHSTTHLLHKALRETLGVHVAQAGSSVNATRLRFDFSHFSALTPEELATVEEKVNDAILAALPITTQEMPIDEAKKLGAMALFGEKYGDVVRVVKMGDYSTELCGGTHLTNTSQAGLFTLISETGVAAGVRRIEGVTGYGTLRLLQSAQAHLNDVAKVLKTNTAELIEKATMVMEDLKDAHKEMEQIREKIASGQVTSLLSNYKEVKGVRIFINQMQGLNGDELRTLGDKMREHMDCGVAVFASEADGKITFTAVASKSAVEKGIHAGKLIGQVAKVAGGGGGGKPDSAQAGGKIPEKIDDALAIVDNIVNEQVRS